MIAHSYTLTFPCAPVRARALIRSHTLDPVVDGIGIAWRAFQWPRLRGMRDVLQPFVSGPNPNNTKPQRQGVMWSASNSGVDAGVFNDGAVALANLGVSKGWSVL